jgi:SNF2 family DNA or RNA helicase
MQLPDKVRDIYEVSATPTQARIYAQLQNELRAAIKDELSGDVKHITVEHILTRLLRLAQVTSGHIKYDEIWSEDGVLVQEGKLEPIPGGNPKLDSVIEMIKEDRESDPKSKTVVWAVFNEDIRVLSERLHEEGIWHTGYKPQVVQQYRKSGADDSEIEFNINPECSVFLGNPASGGTGLNLVGWNFRDPENSPDTYCNHVIYFSKNWSMLQRSQSEDRSAERLSTKCNVRVTDLQIENSIDEEMRMVVFGKMEASKTLQDLDSLLKRVLDTDSLLEDD